MIMRQNVIAGKSKGAEQKIPHTRKPVAIRLNIRAPHCAGKSSVALRELLKGGASYPRSIPRLKSDLQFFASMEGLRGPDGTSNRSGVLGPGLIHSKNQGAGRARE